MPENESPSQDKPEDAKPADGEAKDKKPDDKPADDKAKKKGLPKDEPMTPEQKKKHLESTQRALEKIKAKSKKSRKLNDDQRKSLYRKAVMQKARKLKHFSEVVVMLMLATVIAIHFLPFVTYEAGGKTWGPKRGYQIAVDLVTPKTVKRYKDEYMSFFDPAAERVDVDTIGVFPKIVYNRNKETGEIMMAKGRGVRFDAARPATFIARLYVLLPLGAVLLLLLYVLDYFVFMGRLLPGLSFLYGFGMVGYLMATRLPKDGTWNAFGSMMAWWVWLLLMVPLFLIGAFSMLRSIVSQRYKRYEFRGLPIPEHLKPASPSAKKDDAKADAAAETEAKDDKADKADDAATE